MPFDHPRSSTQHAAPLRPVAVDPPGGPALVLRPLTPADRLEYLQLVRSTRARLDRWLPLHFPGDTDDQLFDRQLELARAGEQTGRAWRRVGCLPDGRIVGGFNLNAIARGLEFEADANWWVADAFTGRGLAAAGVRALLRHAFADLPAGLGLHRIHAGIATDNLASRAVAARAGFSQRPGVRSYLNVTGQWQACDAWAADVAAWRG